MNSPISAELVRRCEERRLCPTVAAICAVLGEAVDAGVIALPDLLDLTRSCSTAAQLGDALAMLATTVPVSEHSEQVLEIPTGDALTMLAATADAYGKQMNCYGATYMTFGQWLEWRNTPQPPRRFVVAGGA